DDLHGADLRGPGERAGRKGGAKGVEAIASRGQLAADVRDEVHDVRVAFDHEALGDLHRSGTRDAADVVPPEVEEHDVLGAFLGVAHQLGGEPRVVALDGTARPRAGDRPDGDRGVVRVVQGEVAVEVDVRNDVDLVRDVVEDEEALREQQAGIGQANVVGGAHRQSLEGARHVVPDVADGAAREARYARHGNGAVLSQQRLQGTERIRGDLAHRAPPGRLHLD